MPLTVVPRFASKGAYEPLDPTQNWHDATLFGFKVIVPQGVLEPGPAMLVSRTIEDRIRHVMCSLRIDMPKDEQQAQLVADYAFNRVTPKVNRKWRVHEWMLEAAKNWY